jgi:hypothetical protein
MQRKRKLYSTEIGGMYTSSFYTVWREEAAGQGRKGGDSYADSQLEGRARKWGRQMYRQRVTLHDVDRSREEGGKGRDTVSITEVYVCANY